MRPQGTPQQLRKRRELAIQLLQAGKIPAVVARAVSADRSSVVRWQQAFKRKGWAGLAAKPIPGRPAGLSTQQKCQLERHLLEGPLAAGYKTDLWTLRRVARLIKKHFHIQYHPGHVGRVLRTLGWSCQNRNGVQSNAMKRRSLIGNDMCGRRFASRLTALAHT